MMTVVTLTASLAVMLLSTIGQQSCGVEANSAVCRLTNTTEVPGILPGEERSLGQDCANCTCYENGHATCSLDCAKPQCWDQAAAQAFCCSTCPNGRNCQTPAGTQVTEGQHVIEDGQNCTCSNFTCGEGCDGPAATCQPVICRLVNGTVIKGLESPGEVWKAADGCERCTCQSSGEVTCKNISLTCTEPDCEDAFYQNGRCCKICPADVGICVLAHTFHVDNHDTVEMNNGTRCTCQKNETNDLTLTCFTPTAEELTAEQEKIDTQYYRISRLRKRVRKLENAVTKIDY